MMTDYFVKRGQKIRGPVTARKIRELAASGKLLTSDEIRRETGDWISAGKIDELFGSTVVISDDELIVDPLAKLAGQTASAVTGAGTAIAGIAKDIFGMAKKVSKKIGVFWVLNG